MSDGFYVLIPSYWAWKHRHLLLTWCAPAAWEPEQHPTTHGGDSWFCGASVAERWHYLYLRWLGFELSVSW